MVRSSLIEILNEDYIRTARAKGLSERKVLTHHALQNSLIPVVTMVGLQFGWDAIRSSCNRDSFQPTWNREDASKCDTLERLSTMSGNHSFLGSNLYGRQFTC